MNRLCRRRSLNRNREDCMAEITVAKTAGFCFGVDRAVKLVYAELEKG